MSCTKSVLCQLENGCMSCCGRDFPSKKEIRKVIEQNTLEFGECDSLIEFRDRALPLDLNKGICRNLIFDSGKIICPLHPELNKGKDLRKGHCDINYLCRTAKEFESWAENKQVQFLEFIKNKKLDNLDFSIAMDKHSLLEEFESSQ